MKYLLKLLLAILVLDSVPTARAALMRSYDLDSLVYKSSEIVQARFLKWTKKEVGIAEVELTAVYQTALQPGARLAVVYLGGYIVGDMEKSRDFKRGDALFLFLNPVTPEEAHNRLPPDRDYYRVVESGVKFVQADRVYSFVQVMNPGPYGLSPSPSDDQAPSLPSVAEFQQSLAKSIPAMEECRKRFAGKPSSSDRPWLLELLRRTRAQNHDFSDELVQLADERIARLHDLELLNAAVALSPNDDNREDTLGGGYGFPAGREYLLARIADAAVPMTSRIESAGMLEGAGAAYASTVGNRQGTTREDEAARLKQEKYVDANAHYLTRIARLARRFEHDKELFGVILSSLDMLVSDTYDNETRYGMKEDRAGVLPVMRGVAADVKDAEDKERARRIVENLSHPREI